MTDVLAGVEARETNYCIFSYDPAFDIGNSY